MTGMVGFPVGVSQILVATGVIFIFFSFIGVIVLPKLLRYEFKSSLQRAALGFIGIFLLCGGVYYDYRQLDKTPVPTASVNPEAKQALPLPSIGISYPPGNGQVMENETIMGTSENVFSSDKGIWILIYAYETQRFYPQKSKADLQNNGSWKAPVTIGTRNDQRKKFDIIAVLADTKAQEAFKKYISDSTAAQSWNGLESMPENVAEYSRVTVIRK